MLPAVNPAVTLAPLASPLLSELPWGTSPKHYGLIYPGIDGLVVLVVRYEVIPDSLNLFDGSTRRVEIMRYPDGFVMEDEHHPHVVSEALHIQAALMEWHDKGLVEVVT